MDGVEIRLLGSLEVTLDGSTVPLPGAAERALLALLCLAAGRTVPATTLIDRLWTGEDLPVDPANALQTRVSKLRRALSRSGLDLIARDGPGYRLDLDPARLDVERFTRAVRSARAATASAGGAATEAAVAAYDEALELWRGDALADFVTETWATVEAARLSQLRLAALTERSETALRLGRHREVVADLESVVAADPTHESLAGLLMTALYRSDRQADALEVFARTRAVLDGELGLEPSAALRAVHSAVLRQDAGLAAVPEAAARPEGPAGARRAGTHVPAPVHELIGRGQALEEVRRLLDSSRLVSLVGPGGAGKTVLAFAAAHGEVAGTFADGTWVARLAPVTDASDVPLAVADALGVPLDGAAPTTEARDRLVSFLARRRLLLVLDNCEHVVDAVARLADDLLASCPDVTVLATSREALAVPGEVQVTVPPLEFPPEDAAPRRVLDYPAAQLLVQRARAVRADLRLDDDALTAVAGICGRLDGMPLALELAAARASSLSLVELADRLEDRFELLTGGARTAEARQRTLRATVDWSHALLFGPEQAVFRRLAAFHGGWTLDAAEAVASGGDVADRDVLDLLGRLVDRSMVTADPGRPTRYRMLETLRQYAAGRLAESGEADAVAAAHAAWFRRLAEESEQALRGPGQRATLLRLREEQPNLRAALSFLAADPARLEDALRLAGALGWFWHLGRHLEGREVLRRLLATEGGSADARARALQAVSLVERPRACLVHPSPRCAEAARASLALFTAQEDEHRAALSRVLLAVEGVDGSAAQESRRLLGEAEDRFTVEGDAWGHAVVAFVRMETYLKTGDEARAVPTGRAAVAAFRALDDPWGLSAVLYHLGWGLRQFGRYADAVPVLEEAIEVSRSAGLYNTTQWALADLGIALLHLGEVEAARDCFDRAGAASAEVGDGAGEVLRTYGQGVLARVAGDRPAARDHFARALAGFQALGTPVAAGLALAGLAHCDEADGLPDAAEEHYREVLQTGESAGEPGLIATGLEGLARLVAGRDRAESDRLGRRARTVRESSARPAPPYERVGRAAQATTVPG